MAPTLIAGGDTVPVRMVAPCQYLSDSVAVGSRGDVAAYVGPHGDSIRITIGNSLKSRRTPALA